MAFNWRVILSNSFVRTLILFSWAAMISKSTLLWSLELMAFFKSNLSLSTSIFASLSSLPLRLLIPLSLYISMDIIATLYSYLSKASVLSLICSTSLTRISKVCFSLSKSMYFSSKASSSAPVLWSEKLACSSWTDFSDIMELSLWISLFFSLILSSIFPRLRFLS